jgi:hypothetical protein
MLRRGKELNNDYYEPHVKIKRKLTYIDYKCRDTDVRYRRFLKARYHFRIIQCYTLQNLLYARMDIEKISF